MEELIQFVKQRISAEDAYAAKLVDVSRTKPRADGFGKDETSLLAQIFSNAKSQMDNLSVAHKAVSDQLALLIPFVQTYLDDTKKLFSGRKDKVDQTAKALVTQRGEMEALMAEYHAKSRTADEEESKVDRLMDADVPVMDVMISVGPRLFTVEDFNTLLAKMQRDVATQDIRSLWGTTKDCLVGKDIISYIKSYLRVDDETSAAILLHLINESFLRPTSRVSVTSLTTSSLSPTQTYTWKRLSIETEPADRRARREADRADHAYRKSCTAVEETRTSLELQCWEYMHAMQQAELERVALVKTTLAGVNGAQDVTVSAAKGVQDGQAVYLETLRPEREVEMMTEHLRTGNVRMPPIVYRSYYGGTGDAIIGVPLDDQSTRDPLSLPPFYQKCLLAIASARPLTLTPEIELSLWLTPSPPPPPHPSIHRPVPPLLAIPLLKHYLSHLPLSIVHPEIYDPLKLLYLSKTDEEEHDGRVGSLTSLVSVMPGVHWAATKALVELLAGVCGANGEQEVGNTVVEMAVALGQTVLRPMVQSPVTLHDKHPVRLMKDMLTHHETIFATAPRNSELNLAATNGSRPSSVHTSRASLANSRLSTSSRSSHNPGHLDLQQQPHTVAADDDDSDDELDIRISHDGIVSSRAGSAASLHSMHSGAGSVGEGGAQGGTSTTSPVGSSFASLKLVQHEGEEEDDDIGVFERA
ncbi:hypothetical protein HKX48_004398 [Thoreauomyces humboldtii]|nr:hypothetical protein HKX48_004398 [Thoreauomyces humboldtii]